MNNVVALKGTREAPRVLQSKMDTIIFSPEEVMNWLIPPMQRPLRVNDKVRSMAEEMKHNGGIISGVLTLGQIKGDKVRMWIVDGQHRIEAFKISCLTEAIADVRIVTFEDMGEMAQEFVNLNSSLVKMRPDDILRGLEPTYPVLRKLRECCPWIGYDNIRRNPSSPTLSMSAMLRCWFGSNAETPINNSLGLSTQQMVLALTNNGLGDLIGYLNTARAAWGGDLENGRLWGNLNLTMTMWIWRRLVLAQRDPRLRTVYLTVDQFKKCMMSLAADHDYSDWLQGRQMHERDRSPCYARIRAIFTRRLKADDRSGEPAKIKFLQPAWAKQ